MLKRMLITSMLALLWLTIQGDPADAQSAYGWDAWLYEPVTRQVWQVDDIGTEHVNFYLPIPDRSYSELSSNLGVSPNGRYFAYFTQSTTNLDYQFLIYDRDAMTMFSGIYQIPGGTFSRYSLNFSGGYQVFSPDSRYLAIAAQTDNTWVLHIIDLSVDFPRIVYSLNSTDSLVAPHLISNGLGVPVIQQVTSTSVTFLYLDSMEAFTKLSGFTWDFATNNLYPDTRFANMGADYLPATGETIASYQDESYPNRLDRIEGYPIQYNVVEAYDPSYGQFVYYNNVDTSVYDVDFAQNGERILIDEYDHTNDRRYWLLRERNGTQLDRMLQSQDFTSSSGVANGFIVMSMDYTRTEYSSLIHYDTVASNTLRVSDVLWNAGLTSQVYIVAVNNYRTPRSADFLPWGEQVIGSAESRPLDGIIGEPAVMPTEAPTASTDRPLAAGSLAIGERARVYTTDGDRLNVRSGPGTSFSVVFELSLDSRVDVLEGPISANGYQWWRIETADGRSGWAVDFVDDIPTLLPE